MRHIAEQALDAASGPGVSYADVRVVEHRDRHVATKNGKMASASAGESVGAGIRVLRDGCWGFAATDDLTRQGMERAAAQAVEIARASAQAKKKDVALAPEQKYEAVWVSPCAVDPFSISVEENLSLLAEASLVFTRQRQFFASSLGSRIDQTRTTSGAGFAAHSYKDDEIQKRPAPCDVPASGSERMARHRSIRDITAIHVLPRPSAPEMTRSWVSSLAKKPLRVRVGSACAILFSAWRSPRGVDPMR